MDMQGYFTAKGLALSAKLLSGATLEVTRVTAGSGHTDKPTTATTLPQIQQELAVNTPTYNGSTAVIPATLVAAQARTSYTLTELGVYAKDPDEGEILYKIYQLSDGVDIAAGSRAVLRFYLEETVSQDLNMTAVCSPAGLITEESFLPVRDLVLAKETPTRKCYLDVSQLQAFLDSLPRLLTEYIYIYLSGTLDEPLSLIGFHGSGGIMLIKDTSAETCVFQRQITVGYCSVFIMMQNLTLQKTDDTDDAAVRIIHGRDVYLSGCTLSGNGVGNGVQVEMASTVYLEGSSLSGFAWVAQVLYSSLLSINGNADGFQNNTHGAYVWHGGIVLLGGGTPELLGGNYHSKSGGLIVNTDGTLL